MRCRECGASLPEDAVECAECGGRVSAPRAQPDRPVRRKTPEPSAPRTGQLRWLTHGLALAIGLAIGIAIGYGIPRSMSAAPAAGRGPSQTTDGEMRLPPGHPDISTMMKGGRAAPAMPMGDD